MNLTNIFGVYLDLDGTLLSEKERHYACYRTIILSQGGSLLPIPEYWELKRQRTSRGKILQLSQYPKTEAEFLSTWLGLIEKKEYLQYQQLKTGVQSTLNRWKNHNIPMSLITLRTNPKNLFWQIKKLQLNHYFDNVIVCSHAVPNPKYSALLTSDTQNKIFVSDTQEDLDQATKLKMTTVAVTTGLTAKNLLKAHYYVENISEIAL